MLNEKIRACRTAMGMSQEELAQRLHVVRQTVSKWEQARSVPDADLLIQLAQALDTTVAELLGEQQGQPDQAKDNLAAQLEQLNQQIACQQERRRKFWRMGSAVVGVFALAVLAFELWGLLHAVPAGAIGGADGATQIYIAGAPSHKSVLLVGVLAGTAALAGLYRTRRK